MKIIFWGTPEFTIPCLESLYHSGNRVVGVVTQPDREQGRGKEKLPSPVKQFSLDHSIPVYQPENPNVRTFVEELEKLSPDVMVLVAYGNLLRKKVLALSPYGFLNVHFSLLPRYRGASPVSAAMLAGDPITGVSIMKLVPRMDAGPVLRSASTEISREDTRDVLELKLSRLAAPLLIETIEELKRGTVQETEQDETRATYCSVLEKEAGRIPWIKESSYLERFVKAMTPWPTAYTVLRLQNGEERRLIVREAIAIEGKAFQNPGTVQKVSRDGIDVETSRGTLRITALQKAGKKTMKAADFLAGNPVQPGDVFV